MPRAEAEYEKALREKALREKALRESVRDSDTISRNTRAEPADRRA